MTAETNNPDTGGAANAHAHPADGAIYTNGQNAKAPSNLPLLLEQLMQIARTSALEEMASGFAHELNQPIAAITTFAQTGERMLGVPTPMVTEARNILHHVGEEALKTGQGIHRIRSLFRGQQVQKTRCTLADMLIELKPVLEFLTERMDARLKIDTQLPLPAVLVDKLRIQHVIFALVQNALESPCDAQARRIDIEASGDRYTVGIAVRDHGAGVAEHLQGQLFRPFFTTKPNGIGLGLASARAIIEAHEGTIGFENAEGGGARFWFRLPADSEVSAT